MKDDDFKDLQIGSHSVFRAVYEQYVDLVSFVIGKFGIKGHRQEEIVQDVFESLFVNSKSIHSVAGLKAWLCATARNKSVDFIRREKVKDSSQRDIGQITTSNYSDHHKHWESMHFMSQIQKVMNSEQDGTILKMFYVEEMSCKEIAEVLKMSVNSVSSILSRLREKIRTNHLDEVGK